MAITKLKTHDKCPVKAVLGPFGNHYGRLVCKKHRKHIQWLNKADFVTIVETIGKFENHEGIIFDKKDIKKTRKSNNGVKERPTRRHADKEFVYQERDGRIWNTVYSWQG